MEPITEKCEGCARILVQFGIRQNTCTACCFPTAKWKNGICNLATHVRKGMSDERAESKMLNPLKASKRSMGK